MQNLRPLAMAALRHPLPWGALATVLLYVGLDAGLVSDPLVIRYLTGHWAEYVCTTMFLVGAAAAVVKAIDLVDETRAQNGALFEGLPTGDLPLAEVPLFVQRLDAQPARNQRSYLYGRLRAALNYLSRRGSTEKLEDELRSLSDQDAERKHASYGLMRMMLWAMPFVGSLGTVIGIGKAVANLGPDVAWATMIPGLEMAFDTTALALLWSVVLMLAVFVADHVETRLLATVDTRAAAELVGRFRGPAMYHGAGPAAGGAGDGTVVVEAMEKMTSKQSEMWQAGLDAATKHWDEQTELLKKQLETSGAGGGAAGPGGFRSPGGGGVGGGGTGGGGAIEPSQLQEVLLQSASLAGLHHGELHVHNEIIRELAEVVRHECRNWPYRKAMRRKMDKSSAPSGDAGVDWLQRE